MARIKHSHHAAKKHTSGATAHKSFPTIFFESISTDTVHSQPTLSEHKPQKTGKNHSAERLVWMWSGVVFIMLIVIISWTRAISASGALNPRAWFQKDKLIQESRTSLKYYFEKQNKDREEMQAIVNKTTAAYINNNAINTLDDSQINQLKQKLAEVPAKASTSGTLNTAQSTPSSLPVQK